MHYRQEIAGCFAAAIGEHGLAERDYAPVLAGCGEALAWLRDQHATSSLPLLALPERQDDLPALQDISSGFRERFENVIVLGTGGSSLGGQTLVSLADIGFGPPSGTPRMVFLDNIDPDTFAELDRFLDWRRTGLLVISKSGSTAETLTQFLTLVPNMVAAVGEDGLARHVVTITEPGDSPLRLLAERFALPMLDHDPGIGGRFSALSLVGLLPAMIAGLAAEEVRAGAAETLRACLEASAPANAPPAAGAALAVALQRHRGITTTVLMPYRDRLAAFGLWYRQLWAESLGKGGQGTTPIRALGTVDQHSQLQLYLDGPPDKMFTLLMGDVAGGGGEVPPDLAGATGLGYLAGRRMGDLLDAEQRATADTLIRHGRPTRVMRVPRLDEAAMGALMMHFMLETIIAARLMGVDAFDQPAVEESKRLARDYLAAMKI